MLAEDLFPVQELDRIDITARTARDSPSLEASIALAGEMHPDVVLKLLAIARSVARRDKADARPQNTHPAFSLTDHRDDKIPPDLSRSARVSVDTPIKGATGSGTAPPEWSAPTAGAEVQSIAGKSKIVSRLLAAIGLRRVKHTLPPTDGTHTGANWRAHIGHTSPVDMAQLVVAEIRSGEFITDFARYLDWHVYGDDARDIVSYLAVATPRAFIGTEFQRSRHGWTTGPGQSLSAS